MRKRGFFSYIKISLLTTILPLIFGITIGVLLYYYLNRNIPKIEPVIHYNPDVSTRVYSDDNRVIGEFFVERRIIVPLSKIPKFVINAFISAEDSRFYEHKGLDYFGIIRALIKNILAGKIVQGGSTITQQIARSLLLTPKRTFSRKIKEAILAYKIERNLSKNQILYIYLNQIYLGHGAYGVEAAAQTYFGKSVSELTLSEAAILAGLPQSPARNSPYTHMKNAKRRRRYVLKRMLEDGYITKEEAYKAINEPIILKGLKRHRNNIAPYFIEYIRQRVEEKYGYEAIYKRGLNIYTTINIPMQIIANNAVKEGIEEFVKGQLSKKNIEIPQAALIAMDVRTGEIKAMVGGRDFKESQFNRAVQARRQPGSAFKPIIYAAAIDKGYSPDSIIIDSPVMYGSNTDNIWKPENYDEKFIGPTTLRDALMHSRNIVTIKILKDIGIDYAINYARRLGIRSYLTRDLSLALGSSSVSLLELTKAYSIFANGGKLLEPIFIRMIKDRDGNIIEANDKKLPIQAITPQTAYIITDLLKGVIKNGTGWRAKALNRPAAGKTGTTNNFIDAWFIGYTPELIAGVWVGYDNEKSLGPHKTGGKVATPIWLKFMKKALAEKPIRDFPIPKGIIFTKTREKGVEEFESFIDRGGSKDKFSDIDSYKFFQYDMVDNLNRREIH
jgi:penicillin-binding protein 1A